MNASVCINEAFKISAPKTKGAENAKTAEDSFKNLFNEAVSAQKTPRPSQSKGKNTQDAKTGYTDGSAAPAAEDAVDEKAMVSQDSLLAALLQLGIPAGSMMNFVQLPEGVTAETAGTEEANYVSGVQVQDTASAVPGALAKGGEAPAEAGTMTASGQSSLMGTAAEEARDSGEMGIEEPGLAKDTVFIVREASADLTGKTEEMEQSGPEAAITAADEPEKENAVLDSAVPDTKTEFVKVKVGDAVDVSKADFGEKLAEKIEVGIARQDNELIIELAPKELGKIVIKISCEAGKTSVTMSCTNPKTLGLLSENASGIGLIIQNNTGSQVNVNVVEEKDLMQQQQQNGGGQGNESGDGRSGRQKEYKENAAADFIHQMRLGLFEAES